LIGALSIQNGIVVIPDYFAPGNKFSRFGYRALRSDNFLASRDRRSGRQSVRAALANQY
jgi:hypothetical protein